jgi:predicted Zn-dependent protease
VPGPSYIPLEDLILAARALAEGQSLKRTAAALGWDMNRMRRCVTRLDSQVRMEGERHWYVTSETALEWLRMRRLCTPDELERAVSMARERVIGNLQKTLDLGARLQREGNHSRAEVIYLERLRDAPGNVKLTAALARCLLETGRPEEALARFDFALAREPGDADIRYGRAIALHHMDRQHDAVSELEIAQRLRPDDAYMLVWLGCWRMRLNLKRDQNVELVKRAMAILTEKYANRGDCKQYCCEITETAFFTLWDHGYADEARAVARAAVKYGWIPDEIAVAVQRRAEARARAADEARASALARLRQIEPPSAPRAPVPRRRSRPGGWYH